MKSFENFYEYEDGDPVNRTADHEDEFEDEQFNKKDNKNLLNQLFQSTATVNNLLDTIPLLYTKPPQQALHKSIAHLPTHEDVPAKVLKVHRSEHDLLQQQQQQISNLLFSNGVGIRSSWDTNLDSLNIDCISTISN